MIALKNTMSLDHYIERIPILIFAFGLSWLMLWTLYLGLSPANVMEESTGFRYFYSLRRVYGDNEYLFLPQGQIPDIISQIVQILLTLRYDVTTVSPRIDVYAYLMTAIPIGLSVVAFIYSVRPLKGTLLKLVLALAWLMPFYLPWNSSINIPTQPDYTIWIPTIGLVTFAFCVRLTPEAIAQPRASLGIRMGLLGAACLGIKVTVVAFAGALALTVLLSGRPNLRVVACFVIAGFTTLVSAFAILLVLYHGNLDHIYRFLLHEKQFLNTAIQSRSFIELMEESLRNNAPVFYLSLLVPILLIGISLAAKDLLIRSMSISYALACCFYAYNLYHRPGFNAEITILWVTALAVVYVALFNQCAWRTECKLSTNKHRMLRLVNLLLLLCFVMAIPAFYRNVQQYFGSWIWADRADKALSTFLAKRPGKIAFLIYDNSFIPLTVDSAIYKGGTNVYGEPYITSKLMLSMFPTRSYITAFTQDFRKDPLDLAPYSTVVFVKRDDGPREKAEVDIERLFNTSLKEFRCRTEREGSRIIVCLRQ